MKRFHLSTAMLAASVVCLSAEDRPATGARTNEGHGYVTLMRKHFDRVLAVGTDQYGKDKSGLWLAAIDVRNGGQPDAPDPARKRTYRLIHSPRGSNLYWDQPAIVAAYNLSRITGERAYAGGADGYVRSFLERCISSNGLLLWGNHLYYDVFTDRTVRFSGGYHEARPLPCAWEIFWRASPEAAERCIREMARQHVKDKTTGLFDRHGSPDAMGEPEPGEDGKWRVDPFLEAGGVLVESLGWLAARRDQPDPGLTDLALRVARFSYNHRDPNTGLLRNQPGLKRWDYYVSTTEVGLWAGSLLRAAEYTGREEFRTMARDAVAAYLRYGYDAETSRYWGKLRIADGTPEREKTTEYAPDLYADLWEPLFPTHNYPMSLAEACLTLYRQTPDPVFAQAIKRWARLVETSMPANEGRGAYADQYGRCIHFLVRAGREMNEPDHLRLASRLAEEARSHLWVEEAGMFRSHPGEDRCDAVDGIGLLFLSLLYLETGREPDMMGFGF